MVDDHTDGDEDAFPGTPEGASETPPVREVDAWAVISYLLSGVILYGGIGWLLDAWLGTRGLVGVGIVLGAAGGIWLVWLRYSKP
jgi:F0F1-type ATP synthase assembly protein I